MLETSKINRLKFARKGSQNSFLLRTQASLNMNGNELSKILMISPRTLTDWKREKLNMSLAAAQKLSNLTNIPIPVDGKIVDWKLHLKNIGRVGGLKNSALYGKVGGNEEYRKKKWQDWWNQIGKFKEKAERFQSIIEINIPEKNKDLAEFVGVMLGDGGVAPYHVHITLSNKEKEYAKYIVTLIKKLFGLVPKIHVLKNSNAIDIVVQRKKLVDFCQEIGLVKGNKITYQVDIPQWIKEASTFSKVCVRGLIDTDGCFFSNSYYSNNKRYTYFKIAFTSASDPLLQSVHNILLQNGISSRISKRKSQKTGDVRIESPDDVRKYIKVFGSKNAKHLHKIKDNYA